MKIAVDDYGQTLATLTDGTVLRLSEVRGKLEVMAYDGVLVVRPVSSNVVAVTAENYFSGPAPTAPAVSQLSKEKASEPN